MNVELIIDDWKKIPQRIRYIFYFGIFLIFIPWLIDHLGNAEVYTFFGWDFRNEAFILGILSILVGFSALLSAQMSYWRRARQYRLKYPIDKLDQLFHLVWFNNVLFLFDLEEKLYYHVYPWETAQDLFFDSTGNRVKCDIENAPEKIPLGNGRYISFLAYEKGGVINTRLR